MYKCTCVYMYVIFVPQEVARSLHQLSFYCLAMMPKSLFSHQNIIFMKKQKA